MKTIEITSEAGITTVALNRPEVRNAFNDTMVCELREAFEGLDKTTRAVVLTGAGGAFCAGADLNWMKKSVAYSEAENAAEAREMAGLFRIVNECSIPVIGRVNGAALGGGVGLVACCDMVVASERAKFGLTEVRLGLVPAVISPFVLGKIPEAEARRYFLTGEIFSAVAAEKMGLVQKVVSPDALDEAVKLWTDALTHNGPNAVLEAKRLVFEIPGRETDDALKFAGDVIARLRVSPEGQEGLAAFLEKREPNWR